MVAVLDVAATLSLTGRNVAERKNGQRGESCQGELRNF